MFRFFAKLLGLFVGASVIVGVVGAVAAVSYKRRAPAMAAPDADEIDFVTVMDGGQLASTARAFRGGRVISWYAGADLDLRGATLDPAGASLDVRTVFGGTRVVVRPDVPVRAHVPAVFGGTMNETKDTAGSAGVPGLEITGFTLFGGLQVVAREPGAELEGWSGAPGAPSWPAHHGGDELPGGDAPATGDAPAATPA